MFAYGLSLDDPSAFSLVIPFFLPHQNELSANYIWARLGCCVVISHIGRIAVDTDDLYAVGIS